VSVSRDRREGERGKAYAMADLGGGGGLGILLRPQAMMGGCLVVSEVCLETGR